MCYYIHQPETKLLIIEQISGIAEIIISLKTLIASSNTRSLNEQVKLMMEEKKNLLLAA